MKFDFVIGNPPFNEEAPGKSTSEKPIYHMFMDAAYSVSDKVELITPARFLFNAGSTPKKWNQQMLSSKHFKVLFYDSDATNIFPNTAITGGIAITYWDATADFDPINTFVPYIELDSIRQKVGTQLNSESLGSIMSGRTPYLFTAKMHEEIPCAKERLSDGHFFDISSNVFTILPEAFVLSDDGKDDYFRVLGRLDNNRTYRWIKKSFVRGRSDDYTGRWKIFLPKANGASGMLGDEPARLISKPAIGRPDDIATDTFICVGSFDTEWETRAAFKYIMGKFCRALLGILKVTQDNSPEKWRFVPLQDFTPASDIDWSKSTPEIDQQLYAKYGLDENEIEFIETHVKEME